MRRTKCMRVAAITTILHDKMASTRCLRSAFEACRPSRTTPFRLMAHRRTYADTSSTNNGEPDIQPRFPEPAATNQLPEKSPPKRKNPAAAGVQAPSNPTNTVPITKTTTTSPSSRPSSTPTPQESSTKQPAGQQTAEPSSAEPPLRPVPINVLALHRAPLKHPRPHGVPVASLQLRSYSVRSLEFFADFALRAAYYLNLPASGPVPLPKRIERWTVLRSNFIFKKSQENFERITYKRNITIYDGDTGAVEVWLAVLRKWQFNGVGMKANVWQWSGIDVDKEMDANAKDLEKEIEAKLSLFGWNKNVASSKSIKEELEKQGVKHVGVGGMELREGSQRRHSEL